MGHCVRELTYIIYQILTKNLVSSQNFLSLEVTTVIRIGVHILTPILVVFRNILTHRNLVELNPVEILNLLLKWEMVVSVTMQRVVAEVNVKPFLDPCVNPKELHKNLVTLDVVDYIHVNELWDER